MRTHLTRVEKGRRPGVLRALALLVLLGELAGFTGRPAAIAPLMAAAAQEPPRPCSVTAGC